MAATGYNTSSFDSLHCSNNGSMLPLQYSSNTAPSPISAAPSPQPAYELIPHRIFVGGFPTATTEHELRTFFEQFGHIREAKVIRSGEGSSKGYGFVTFDTEDEAQAVRNMDPEKFEFKGRRLNLGPAMRRVSQGSRFTDFAVASPTPYLTSPTLGYAYQTGYPSTPYLLVSPSVPSFFYSPMSPSQEMMEDATATTRPATPTHATLSQAPPPLNTQSGMSHYIQRQPMNSAQQMTPGTPLSAGIRPSLTSRLYGSNMYTTGPYNHNGPTDMTHYSQMGPPTAYYYSSQGMPGTTAMLHADVANGSVSTTYN